MDSLSKELVASSSETERIADEMDKLRISTSKSAAAADAAETSRLELRHRELQETVEALRLDLDRWESAYMEEKSSREDSAARAQRAENARKEAEDREQRLQQSASQDKLIARQLQQALEELQLSQEKDVQRTIDEMQQQIENCESELETYKGKAFEMGEKLREAHGSTDGLAKLEQEVKEKNLLIGKLRHEAVILNEHLTEALRQIRRDASDTLVDRRLVTNLFLQFLTAPRADAKRFEILRLVASVLHWTDDERSKAGLQRLRPQPSRGFLRFMDRSGRAADAGAQPADDVRAAVHAILTTQSVSNLFVEFLLSEADRGRAEGGSSDHAPAPQPSDSAVKGADFDLHSLEHLADSTQPTPPGATGSAPPST